MALHAQAPAISEPVQASRFIRMGCIAGSTSSSSFPFRAKPGARGFCRDVRHGPHPSRRTAPPTAVPTYWPGWPTQTATTPLRKKRTEDEIARQVVPLTDPKCRLAKFNPAGGNKLFDGGGLDRVFVMLPPDGNTPFANALHAFGFNREGLLRAHHLDMDGWQERQLGALTAPMWRSGLQVAD
ncbi:hypothetical protein G6F63_014356 [Rhizopus arrhizus]|nr:hypothetical protein G6F63_014356 [Rhizopus arrhizus]